MSYTINNQIMLNLVERMKGIVDGLVIRTPTTNQALVSVFDIAGSLAIAGPVSIQGQILANSVVEFTYGDITLQHDFSVDSNFLLFDTGYTLSVADLTLLFENDLYSFDMNTCYSTINDIRTWMTASADAQHPFLVVYPQKFNQDNNLTGKRREIEALYTLHVENDFGAIDSDDAAVNILELCGDIENEIQRDPRFSGITGACFTIDAQVTEIQPYISSANDNLAGAFLTLSVKYRTDLTDSRKLKP